MLINSDISQSNKNEALLYSGKNIIGLTVKSLVSQSHSVLASWYPVPSLLGALLNKKWIRSSLKRFNSNILWIYKSLQMESMYKKMSQTKESRNGLRKVE